MSYWKISASSKATRSESSASAAAWNSELWMVALAVRVRTSSGFSSTSLLKPLASRVTFSVSLSDSLRSRPTSSPPRCMKRSNSPGFSRSTWLRSSGRLRKRREIGEVQFEAAEQPVHRVVAADDHFDGGEAEARFVRCRRGSPARWRWPVLGCGLRRSCGARASRGSATSAATMATSPICSRQAVRVESPGMADLMKIGTIYTT